MAQIDISQYLAALTPRQRRLLLALIGGAGTKTQTAEEAGVSRRTLYRYLDDAMFKSALEGTNILLLRATASQILAATGTAVEALRRIAEDSDAKPAERAQAASKILDCFFQHTEKILQLSL
ncbi:MAG TPA: helix-turn-helix domain-containing protein [Myxococcota bacterium]|nr:helix-turn-helix domain-containing protein [Myxococcota bacterium]